MSRSTFSLALILREVMSWPCTSPLRASHMMNHCCQTVWMSPVAHVRPVCFLVRSSGFLIRDRCASCNFAHSELIRPLKICRHPISDCCWIASSNFGGVRRSGSGVSWNHWDIPSTSADVISSPVSADWQYFRTATRVAERQARRDGWVQRMR